jgi:ribose transport system substrate-binding protein
MKIWSLTLLAALATLLALGPVGCGTTQSPEGGSSSATSDAATGEPDAVIGLSLLTSDNPFFGQLADALRDEAAKYHYEVIVTAGQQKPLLQDQQVDDFITRKVSAIVLCPCDSQAVGATIEKANQAGIPVFTADIASLSDRGQVVCHVATDNFGGGTAAAEAVTEMLGGKGKVAVLNHPRIESAILREKGFTEGIKKAPDIEIVQTLFGGGERKASFDSTKDLLQTYPDINGLFCINDPSALGAARALKELGKDNQVKIVGFDAQTEARKAVKEGTIYATIVQYPEKIGATTARAIHDHLIGKEVDKEILIPVSIYRTADAESDPLLQ